MTTDTGAPARRDYRSTLNLTLSDKDPRAFPQRGNLPEREPEFQARWDSMGLYRLTVDRPAERGRYLLHDGPPYSNGDIHVGTAMNKIAKDVVTRFRTMQGYSAPYIPGWDNHGMPIENGVAKRFREKGEAPDRITLRRACREWAREWVDRQRTQFRRLGVRGDWENPYLTMSSEFEAAIVESFGELHAGGYIYRGLRPVLWCATCETALADAEVEYHPHTSRSITVRFPLLRDPLGVFGHDSHDAYALIWTTTPWTIPANLAVAVHPDAEYVVARIETGAGTARYLVAEALLGVVAASLAATAPPVVENRVRGADLGDLVFRHPLFDRESPLVTADYVTMDAGTGVVHTAPGHGKEDFDTGRRFGLEVLNPVDASGRYTEEAGVLPARPLAGLRVTDGGPEGADAVITAALAEAGALMAAERLEHSYPHCWRCHGPLIFRATVQWFMNIDHAGHRERCIAAIETVKWVPAETVNRISNMVSGRPDWCLSRQRSWGVGVPAFFCDACGEAVVTPESISAIAAMTRRESSDAWYEREPAQILPEGYRCPNCGAAADRLRKETDVLDVWFDSGNTQRAVLENQAAWPDVAWPADLYLEGGDQHRGWFNSSLMVAVATRGAAPYRAVVTNGWTLDEQGKPMHKSLGNALDPMDVVRQYGADILRWWVASTDFKEDMNCGDNLIRQVAETYRRVRNTFRFLVNNLYDFEPERDSVAYTEMTEFDRWAVAHLDRVTAATVAAYEAFAYQRVYHTVHAFCAVELSSFYLDALKDRLYASGANWPERRSAQTAMYRLAHVMARLLAPLLPHTAEEVWDRLPGGGREPSVHLAMMPEPDGSAATLVDAWQPFVELRDVVNREIEAARSAGVVANALEAAVEIEVSPDAGGVYERLVPQMASLLLVSQCSVALTPGLAAPRIVVRPADGAKCPRCWLMRTDIGSRPEEPELCGRCAEAVAAQTERNDG